MLEHLPPPATAAAADAAAADAADGGSGGAVLTTAISATGEQSEPSPDLEIEIPKEIADPKAT
eukprot:scaffold63662_cov24-Phaeocystis_antarctica.AAC.1